MSEFSQTSSMNFFPNAPSGAPHLAAAGVDPVGGPWMIEVRDLSKRVPSVGADTAGAELSILHSVDFTVSRAETLAIVGASGSGKSTLLGLLAGLDTPSSGRVLLDGVDIYSLDEDGRAGLRMAKLGFVFQSFQLLAHLTALENVMLPLELRGDPKARDKAAAMLGRVGLGARLKHYPKHLSGGEQQRVALARAFVPEPPLLFADEPTGSLDAASGEAVIQLMFELNRERGSTLVLVTHDTSIAARCARTITIAAGKLVPTLDAQHPG
jgi:putative ABC transport system ATP-binding protein